MAAAVPKDNDEITTLSFSIPRAARIVRISPRQVDYWIARGYVTASVERSSAKSGYARGFTPREMQGLKALAEFVKAGLSPRSGSLALAALRASGINLPYDGVLLVGDGQVVVVDGDANVYDVVRGMQGAFALFLGIEVPRLPPQRRTRPSSGSPAALPPLRRVRARASRSA
jgi:hypothetical protein